ncbi:ShlB/FhaC/HecB family hemolysin secretion/activation protein [Gilvimarinus sp. F26214L]|uniref:ShlB/FhaC/HecB family hemolysin secretion/activation protein n=1 Tax=Gilvimarinus sp. DZF01 TaxID=3461371 RepID=UPI0040459589
MKVIVAFRSSGSARDHRGNPFARMLNPILLRGATIVTALGVATVSLQSHAGFLEMPDTREVPEFERDSMLLDMDIPGVRDRDPDPMAGPRLNVKEFRVQGLIEYPELGIHRHEIIEQVERIRFDLMEEGELLDSGYTLDEISEVSDLVAEIEKETEGRHVSPVEVQRLVFLIREQRRQRGITLGMIETVAGTITRYYRERGFILAKAYIPQQHVRDGVVNLTLLLGELGEVEVHNNDRYSDKRIQRVFAGDMAEPVVSSRVEEKLFLVSDMPGLSAQGYFEPGTQVGDTRLNVNVLSERWYDASVRTDNHGSARTGEYRTYVDALWHNPTGTGDQLHLGLLGSFKPDNSTYGSLRYNTRILHPRLRFGLGASNNDFVLGSGNAKAKTASNFQIEGESLVVDASLRYQLKRSRANNHAIGLRASEVESTITLGGISADFLDDTVRNTEIFYAFDLLDEDPRILHQGEIRVISSDFLKGAEEAQPESVYVGQLDYSMLTFLKVPFTEVESRVVFRMGVQYAGESLAATNQHSLAGPTRARGFAVNEYYADDAVSLGADWVFSGPSFGGFSLGGERLKDMFQPFLFADVGYGKAHPYQRGAEGTEARLADMGFGLRINYKRKVRGTLSFAFPVSSENTALGEGERLNDDMNFYFDLQTSF